jgi:hypothetical protein
VYIDTSHHGKSAHLLFWGAFSTDSIGFCISAASASSSLTGAGGSGTGSGSFSMAGSCGSTGQLAGCGTTGRSESD